MPPSTQQPESPHARWPASKKPLLAQPKPRVVTFRAILLGFLGVFFICGFTPFNDYILESTFIVGNFLPMGLLLFFLVFILAINAPLSRFFPKRAFRSGELSVALAMTLVSCCLPSSGLMRYLPVGEAAIPWYSNTWADIAKLFYDPSKAADPNYLKDIDSKIKLPQWMFPAQAENPKPFDPVNLPQLGRENVISNFRDRAPAETFWGHVRAVPWNLWRAPAIGWSLLLLPMFGAMVLMTVLLRRQWVENERLPFPIATIYLSLIETPPPGKLFNSLFSDRGFWIAFMAVFTIHGFNGLHTYWPKYVPGVQISFNLISLFSDYPWMSYVEYGPLLVTTIFFCIIGISYFLQSKIAFSLFFSFLLYQVMRFSYGVQKLEYKETMRQDEIIGSALTLALIIIWVGRQQWILIIRQMLRGPANNEPAGKYLSYRAAGWGFLLCIAMVILWLKIAGATLIGGAAFVVYIMLMFMVLARVVAETGMIFTEFNVAPMRIWQVPLEISARLRTTSESFFFTRYIGWIFFDTRESLIVYSGHALKVADEAAYPDEQRARKTWPFLSCLAFALVAGLVISYCSTLYIHYTYAQTLSNHPTSPISGNAWNTINDVFNITRDYLDPNKPNGKYEGHHHYPYILVGALVTAILGFLRLRFAAWPLHPIGFLVGDTYPVFICWFSIMLGWLAKILIVRFGGTKLYKQAQGFFIGLVVGESSAAAFWMLFGLVRYLMGETFYSMHLLPS